MSTFGSSGRQYAGGVPRLLLTVSQPVRRPRRSQRRVRAAARLSTGVQGRGPSDGSERFSLPDTCPDWGSGWSFRSSSCYGRGLENVGGGPYVRSNQNLPFLLARGSRRDQDHSVRSNAEAQACRRCSAVHRCPSRHARPQARRGKRSTQEPDDCRRASLDVRNQPDSHCPRRTERRHGACCFIRGSITQAMRNVPPQGAYRRFGVISQMGCSDSETRRSLVIARYSAARDREYPATPVHWPEDDEGMGGPSVVGRERESGLLVRLLGEVNDRGSSLVSMGIAGIGESTLPQDARRTAWDGHVSSAMRSIPRRRTPFRGPAWLRRAVPQAAAPAGTRRVPKRGARTRGRCRGLLGGDSVLRDGRRR